MKKKFYIILLICFITLTACVNEKSNRISSTTYYHKANYSEAYTNKVNKNISVETPEIYELFHIIIAISDYGNKPFIFKKDQYYDKVMKTFSAYKDHSLVQEINDSLQESRGNYNNWKDHMFAYHFDENGKILKDEAYEMKEDKFYEHKKAFEDFAEKSGFQAFYDSNKKFYEKQAKIFQEKIPIKKMWIWLENQFPVQYNSYTVYYSPLAGNTPHNTIRYKDENKDFIECIMFVSEPDYYELNWSHARARGLMNSNIFTEIDHNYVNPTTDRYLEDIHKAMEDTKKWNRQSGYGRPVVTFNEYMTWAAFICYAYDHFENKDLFEASRELQEMIMVDARKFVNYKAFNKAVLNLYKNRAEGTTLADLYPEIIRWIENYN